MTNMFAYLVFHNIARLHQVYIMLSWGQGLNIIHTITLNTAPSAPYTISESVQVLGMQNIASNIAEIFFFLDKAIRYQIFFHELFFQSKIL